MTAWQHTQARSGRGLSGHTMHAAMLLALVTCLIGCATGSTGSRKTVRIGPPAGDLHVTVGGDALKLGRAQQTALRPDALAEIVSKLLAEQRYYSASIWVHRYPDVAIELLRNASPQTITTPTVRFIAAQHDRQCGRADAPGWSQVLPDAAQESTAYNRYQQQRAGVIAAIREGRLDEAAGIDLTSAVPSGEHNTVLRIEAYRLHGIALLLSNDKPAAADTLTRAAELAQSCSTWQRAHLLLLASDASRRAGRTERSDQQWREAVRAAVSLVSDEADMLQDPLFWEQAIALKPAQTPWPDAVDGQLADALTHNASDLWQSDTTRTLGSDATTRTERLAWCNIALWRLSRQEAQAALLSIGQARGMAGSSDLRDELALQQARALSMLGQDTAAMNSLVTLMARPDNIGRSAHAIAGVLSIQQGQTQRGVALLQRAVQDAPDGWPGRDGAEIDLALGQLILGEQDAGLERLHRVQRRLGADDRELLIKSLRNEGRYLLAVSDSAALAEVTEKTRAVESELD